MLGEPLHPVIVTDPGRGDLGQHSSRLHPLFQGEAGRQQAGDDLHPVALLKTPDALHSAAD
jgi:hypothetical protein